MKKHARQKCHKLITQIRIWTCTKLLVKIMAVWKELQLQLIGLKCFVWENKSDLHACVFDYATPSMSIVASKGQYFSGTSFTASPMFFHTTTRQCIWDKSRPNRVQWTYQSQRCQHIRRKTWSNDLGLNFILKPEHACWMYQVDSTSPTAI